MKRVKAESREYLQYSQGFSIAIVNNSKNDAILMLLSLLYCQQNAIHWEVHLTNIDGCQLYNNKLLVLLFSIYYLLDERRQRQYFQLACVVLLVIYDYSNGMSHKGGYCCFPDNICLHSFWNKCWILIVSRYSSL